MKHVLLVDDEQPFLKSLSDGLASFASLEVVTATDGKQAVAVLARTPIDLVVTDLRMPEMGGFELLAYVSRHHPRLPVIVMTAFATPATRATLEQDGALACLDKPLDFDDLADKIFETLLERQRSSLRGISVASFLQLLAMDRMSCRLWVTHEKESGSLTLSGGKLVQARVGDQKGDEAAHTIIGWGEAVIDIDKFAPAVECEVKHDLSYLIIETLRRKDEEASKPSARNRSIPPTPAPHELAASPSPPTSHAPAADRRRKAPITSAAEAGRSNGLPEPVDSATDKGWDDALALAAPDTQQRLVIPKETEMALEKHLQSLRDINGYKASAIMNFTGEALAVDTADPAVDLNLVGATFNDIFRSAHEASKKIGLDATREAVFKTPKGIVVMQCSGVDSKVHFHLIVVLAAEGNQALTKMRLDAIVPKVMGEL